MKMVDTAILGPVLVLVFRDSYFRLANPTVKPKGSLLDFHFTVQILCE